MASVIYSVNDINNYIKAILSNDKALQFIYVKGEISNLKIAATGHIYFSLKDNESTINAVLFSNYASKLIFTPKNGDEVTVLASVDSYVPRGSYQLFCYEMSLKGQGTILEELEKLKKKLASEGLFDEDKKRNINIFPHSIGIITAKNSAAIKDLTFNIKRRYPLCEIYFFPSSVQGENAPKELLKAFELSQKYPLDTLIIGRGGGASEDLSAFNDEALVRALAKSKMPTIAAIGHEIDSTLADYVCDKRASTPTGAAELATVDQREILQKISFMIEDMKSTISNKLETYKQEILNYKENLKLLISNKIEFYKNQLEYNLKHLIALNPTEIMNRGYSITLDKNGKTINSINNANIGEVLYTKFADGTLVSKVEDKQNG